MYQQQTICWLWLAERSSCGRAVDVDPEEKKTKKRELDTCPRDEQSDRKLRYPFWVEHRKGVPHTQQGFEDGSSKQARTKTTRENEEDNIKVCVCSQSSHDFLFLTVLLKRSTHFHTIFLASRQLLRGVVANKFLYYRTKRYIICS